MGAPQHEAGAAIELHQGIVRHRRIGSTGSRFAST
jgi:hypothetical protein